MTTNNTHLFVVEAADTFINLDAIDLIEPHQVEGYTLHFRGGAKHRLTSDEFNVLKKYLTVLNSKG